MCWFCFIECGRSTKMHIFGEFCSTMLTLHRLRTVCCGTLWCIHCSTWQSMELFGIKVRLINWHWCHFYLIGYWHDDVICVSVCPSICNAVYYGSQGRCTGLKVVPACSWQAFPIHFFRQVNRKCPLRTRCYKFQFPTPTLSPQTPHLLHHRHTLNKQTAKISTPGIAIVSMLHSYSKQCSTIGVLSIENCIILFLAGHFLFTCSDTLL